MAGATSPGTCHAGDARKTPAYLAVEGFEQQLARDQRPQPRLRVLVRRPEPARNARERHPRVSIRSRVECPWGKPWS